MMTAKRITICGAATKPGVWIYVAKVSRFEAFFVCVFKKSFETAQLAMSPLSQLAARLSEGDLLNCLAAHIEKKQWSVKECQLELSCYGPLEENEHCKGKTLDELNAIALVVESRLAGIIAGAGYEIVGLNDVNYAGDPAAEPIFTANNVLSDILPELNAQLYILAEDDSPEDDSPEDDSPTKDASSGNPK